MSTPIQTFRGTIGINNKVDPVRLRFDPDTGISELAACVNCDVDDTGRPSRREGYEATVRTESWHSIFGCGNYGVGVTGNALCIIEHDMTYTPIRNVIPEARMSYHKAFDGAKDVIYYTNGFENGRIWDKVSHTWAAASYIGVRTRKTFYAAPIGQLLEIRNLRMFIAQNNILWYSEPGSYSLFRMASEHFAFPNKIRMVQAVSGGLWVSDSEAIYWLGEEILPTTMEMPIQVKMANYPAKKRTAVKVDGSMVGEGLVGTVILFSTTKGVCIGTSDGQLINITERKLDLPYGLAGAGFYKDGKYICITD